MDYGDHSNDDYEQDDSGHGEQSWPQPRWLPSRTSAGGWRPTSGHLRRASCADPERSVLRGELALAESRSATASAISCMTSGDNA
jgi:hypothetical protein